MNLQLQSSKKVPSTSLPPIPRQPARGKCACGGTPGPTGECAACRRKRLQRQQAGRQGGPAPVATGLRPQPASARQPAFSFGRLPLPVEARCSMEGGCPEEPLIDHQGSGSTWCDTATGTMQTTLTEHCAGDCVAQHEAVHRQDRQACCTGVKRCIDNAGDAAGRQACIDSFNTWFPRLSDWTECNAYSREVTCLTNFIAANCGDGGSTGEECCRTLRSELAFATRQRTDRCAAAVFAPCPFAEPGVLGPGDFPLPDPDAPRYA